MAFCFVVTAPIIKFNTQFMRSHLLPTMPATSYFTVKDLSRVRDFDPNKTYRVPIETGTGHFKAALTRFGEDGWEYLNLDYDRWLPVSDGVQIWTFD